MAMLNNQMVHIYIYIYTHTYSEMDGAPPMKKP